MNEALLAKKIAKVARRLARAKKSKLDELKARSKDASRPDFVWRALLQSFATMGGSSGATGLIKNAGNFAKVAFSALSRLSPAQRKRHVTATCIAAKVRFANRKAEFILAAFDRVSKFGGLAAARRALFAQKGHLAKMKFLQCFKGIGKKYSRNLMMDVYDPDFRDHIAIDSRIKRLSTGWGLHPKTYEEHENFYRDVARRAGLNAWELDRLLYWFATEFENSVRR